MILTDFIDNEEDLMTGVNDYAKKKENIKEMQDLVNESVQKVNKLDTSASINNSLLRKLDEFNQDNNTFDSDLLNTSDLKFAKIDSQIKKVDSSVAKDG